LTVAEHLQPLDEISQALGRAEDEPVAIEILDHEIA
jgi:hypothetical protein